MEGLFGIKGTFDAVDRTVIGSEACGFSGFRVADCSIEQSGYVLHSYISFLPLHTMRAKISF